jgi:hypothetical protein
MAGHTSQTVHTLGGEVVLPYPDLDDLPLLVIAAEGPRLRGTRCLDCGRSSIGQRQVCSYSCQNLRLG